MKTVWDYPRTMGSVAAFNENLDYCTDEIMTRAIEISRECGDDAVTREYIEQAIREAKGVQQWMNNGHLKAGNG
jgi:hypothetical protein